MLPLKLIGRRVPAGTPTEIIFFVIAAVIMALGLLPFVTEVRFILRLSGLILAAPGVALFALIVYPRETPLLLGACSMIAGAGWEYVQITRWLAHRGTRRSMATTRRSLS
jgi:hypothetical protein